jgi:hypothetical protein
VPGAVASRRWHENAGGYATGQRGAALADVVGHEGRRQLVDALVAEAFGAEDRTRFVGEQAGDLIWVRALHRRHVL